MPQDAARAPHLLYGHVSAREVYSVGRYARGCAQRALAEARAMGKLPIFVGGTGLYFMALTEGLADIPAYRRRRSATSARALLEEIGVEALHARLTARDPKTAARCAPAIRSACCAPMKCSKPPAGRWPIGSNAPARRC